MNDMMEARSEDQIAWVTARLRRLIAEADGTDSQVFAEIEDVARIRLSQGSEPQAHRMLAALGLSQTEREVVWFMAAFQLSAGCRTLTASLGFGEVQLETLRTVIYESRAALAFKELSSDALLRGLGILERIDGGPSGMHESRYAWGLSTRVLGLLHSYEDVSALAGLLLQPNAPREQLALNAATEENLSDAVRAPDAVVCAYGLPGTGRRTALASLATAAGVEVLQVDARRFGRDVATFRVQLRAVAMECRLRGLSPLIANVDALEDGERSSLVAAYFAPMIGGRILLTSVRRLDLLVDRPTIFVEVGNPTTAQRASLWHSSLGEGTAEDANHLAERYPLAPALIVRASEAAKARANGRALVADDIHAGIRSVLDDRLGEFAKRVTVTQSWDDLVLPPDQLDTIIELMARVRDAGRCTSSGASPRRSARASASRRCSRARLARARRWSPALIARELGLELYQVDMLEGRVEVHRRDREEPRRAVRRGGGGPRDPAVRRGGRAVRQAHRGEVEQRSLREPRDQLPAAAARGFTGICLLTTNHERHIDPAFQRRLSLHLRFPLPDVDERAQLWRAHAAGGGAARGDVDFGSLARRFAMSGGYIRNAALRAAFLAADEDSAITAAHLERAARVEYEGMGKLAA